MDTPGTHCSNEGHLLHIWQRKIVFIKSHGKQNVRSCFFVFFLFLFKEQALLLKSTQLQKLNKEGEWSDNQKAVLSGGKLKLKAL